MYYVNQEQISARLAEIPQLSEALRELYGNWRGTALEGLAQERCLHLAIEIVTDVGSYLIDGFIMRDASSYEDIIDITGAEGVFTEQLRDNLIQLVKLRKPIVQDYYSWPRAELHHLTGQLSDWLEEYKTAVEHYLIRELA